MKLLDTLKKKRDHHLQMAGKFVELIAVLETDPDLAKGIKNAQRAIVNGAHAKLAAPSLTPGGWTEAPPAPPRRKHKMTKAQRKAAGDRMRKMVKERWRKKRAEMLAISARGAARPKAKAKASKPRRSKRAKAHDVAPAPPRLTAEPGAAPPAGS